MRNEGKRIIMLPYESNTLSDEEYRGIHDLQFQTQIGRNNLCCMKTYMRYVYNSNISHSQKSFRR